MQLWWLSSNDFIRGMAQTWVKAVLQCNFLSNLSRNAVARQVAGELHSVTRIISHFFLLREALHEIELSFTCSNGLQQLATPLHSVSRLHQLVLQFYGSSCFSFRGVLRDKLLRKLHSVTGPQHETSATCNATFSSIARQVAEKIVQYNRAFADFVF